MKTALKPALIFLLLMLARCGYTGDPLPPALMIPEPVRDLEGLQQGDSVVLRFTVPAKTTEDLLLKTPPEIELRAAPNPEGGFDIHHWFSASTRIENGQVRDGRAEFRAPAQPWAGREMVFAVRAIGPKRRPSEWSNLLVLRIVPPPRPPQALRAEGTPQGVLLVWEGEGNRWRVFRVQGNQRTQAAEVGEKRWLDEAAQYGAAYEYAVQQVVETGAVPAVSELSAPVRIEFEDRFPPAPPAGLRAIAGPGAIELSWERNTEPDWKAYQVWRAEQGGELVRLGPPITASSFSDTGIVSGTRYRYAVSAIDERGNESRPCEPVEIVAP
ncbi:MAG: fibronectin type III domain-containing protein [Bryobacteraceae bacterium]